MGSPLAVASCEISMDFIMAAKALEIRRFRQVKPGSNETSETGFHTASETGFTSGETPLKPGSK